MRERGLDSRPRIKLLQNGAAARTKHTAWGLVQLYNQWTQSIQDLATQCSVMFYKEYKSIKAHEIDFTPIKNISTDVNAYMKHWIWTGATTHKLSYWCCCHGAGPHPLCRFCLKRTLCHCLHTSSVMVCVHHRRQGGRTWSLRKLGNSFWAARCDFVEIEDEELHSSPRSWWGRKTGQRERRQEYQTNQYQLIPVSFRCHFICLFNLKALYMVKNPLLMAAGNV